MGDSQYRAASTYEYGTAHRVEVYAFTDYDICWGYTIIRDDESKQHCGGFTGPFEALAGALEQMRHEAKEQK